MFSETPQELRRREPAEQFLRTIMQPLGAGLPAYAMHTNQVAQPRWTRKERGGLCNALTR
jgi:hypothetical protein